MADITNVEAVKFSNEKVRVLADQHVTLYETCKRFVSEWNANPSLGAAITNVATDIIIDGAAVDGRHVLNGQLVNQLKTNTDTVIGWYETIVSGGLTRIDIFKRISVNGQARF